MLFCVHLEVFEYFWTPKKSKWTYIYKNETTSVSALNAHSHDGGNDLSLHIKEEAQSPQHFFLTAETSHSTVSILWCAAHALER